MIKKINYGVIALILGASLAFAGTTKSIKSTNEDAAWFELKAGGNPSNAADYERKDEEPACSTGSNVCAILAEPQQNDPDRPDLGAITPGSTKMRSEP